MNKKTIVGLTALMTSSFLVVGFGINLCLKPTKQETVATKSSYWDSWVSSHSDDITEGGETLYDALNSKVASGFIDLSYADLWTAYQTTDLVPGSTNLIWDMYGGFQFRYGTDQAGNYSKEGDVYNREHSVPKSWFSEAQPAHDDLVHLVPTDGYVNNKRGNYAFGEVATASYSYKLQARSYNGVQYQEEGYSKLGTPKSINGVSCPASPVFEPADQYKGDFARIYFYFAVRYGNNSNCRATTGDGGAIFKSSYTDANPYLTDYGKALLLKWHNQDPVSEKETTRNDGIESIQGNRNPFVDYPEWVDKVFNHTSGTDPVVNSVTVSPSTLSLNLTNNTTGNLTATVSVSNGAAQTVNWTTSNSNVATVNSSGVVTAVGVGTATITATSTVNSNKKDTCTVTVTESGSTPEPSSSEVIDLNNQGYTNGSTVSTASSTNATATFAQGSGSNPPKYYTTGTAVRCYPNNTITVASTNNKNIVKIVFTFGTGDSSNAITASTGSFSEPTWTGSSKSVTFTIGGSSGHRRIASIEVFYEGSSSVSLSSITLNTDNVKKTFTVGETFTYSGLVVTAHYSDNSTATVTPTSVSSPDMSTAGTKTITVTYNDKTATYTITVNAATPTSITATVDRAFYVGETISKSDIVVKDNLNNVIANYSFSNYQFTYTDGPSGGSSKNKSFTISYSNMSTTLSVSVSRKAYVTPVSSVKDTITASDLTATGTSYVDFSNVSKSSGAVYAGQSAKDDNGNIQIRSKNSNSGIISTTSGGSIQSVKINVASGSNAINVYGKNTAYDSASDLFGNAQGTLVGSVTSTGTVTFNTSYQYVGIRSNSGAVYISSIEITYGGAGGETANNVANYIMYEDTTDQCLNKFGTASGYFNNLSNSEKSTFMTSTDYVISAARARFEAWAANRGKTITYSNGTYSIVNAAYRMISFSNENNTGLVVLLIGIGMTLSTVFVAFYFLRKRKN